MSMSRADEAVAELLVDINDKQKVLDAIQYLQKLYPDLKVERDGRITSFTSIKFCSGSVNCIVDGADIFKGFHSFDALKNNEEIVEAWPFTTVEGYKIYSDPPSFTIGQTNNSGFGVTPKAGWEDAMEEAGIARPGIRAAKDHLKKNPPITYNLYNTQDTETP